jgi:hypothetical protein
MVMGDLQFIHQWIEEGQMGLAAEALALIEKRIQTLNDKLVFLALKTKLENENFDIGLFAQVENFLQNVNLKQVQEEILKNTLASLYIFEADHAYKEAKWDKSVENYNLALSLETLESNRSWCYRQLTDIALRANNIDLLQKINKQFQKESGLDDWLQDEIDFETLIKQYQKMKNVLTAF